MAIPIARIYAIYILIDFVCLFIPKRHCNFAL